MNVHKRIEKSICIVSEMSAELLEDCRSALSSLVLNLIWNEYHELASF
jgi:hypothetical protein